MVSGLEAGAPTPARVGNKEMSLGQGQCEHSPSSRMLPRAPHSACPALTRRRLTWDLANTLI